MNGDTRVSRFSGRWLNSLYVDEVVGMRKSFDDYIALGGLQFCSETLLVEQEVSR